MYEWANCSCEKNRERIWIKAKYLCSYVPRFRGNIGYCAVCKYTEKWKLWSQKVGASNGERILEKIWGICQNTDFLWNGIDLTWVLIIICSKPESGSFSSQKILRHSVRMSLGFCPAEPRNWKWPNGVWNSEMSIILCISITNNVKTCKKFNESAQTTNFIVFTRGHRWRSGALC